MVDNYAPGTLDDRITVPPPTAVTTLLGTVAGVTPIWLTIVVAVLSVSGALAAQWLASSRAYRLALIERETRRAERDRQSREDAYTKFLAAARAIKPGKQPTADPSATESASTALREAAAHIELYSPDLAEGPLAVALAAAERLLTLPLAMSPSAPAVREAEREFDEALAKLRRAMHSDLDDS